MYVANTTSSSSSNGEDNGLWAMRVGSRLIAGAGEWLPGNIGKIGESFKNMAGAAFQGIGIAAQNPSTLSDTAAQGVYAGGVFFGALAPTEALGRELLAAYNIHMDPNQSLKKDFDPTRGAVALVGMVGATVWAAGSSGDLSAFPSWALAVAGTATNAAAAGALPWIPPSTQERDAASEYSMASGPRLPSLAFSDDFEKSFGGLTLDGQQESRHAPSNAASSQSKQKSKESDPKLKKDEQLDVRRSSDYGVVRKRGHTYDFMTTTENDRTFIYRSREDSHLAEIRWSKDRKGRTQGEWEAHRDVNYDTWANSAQSSGQSSGIDYATSTQFKGKGPAKGPGK